MDKNQSIGIALIILLMVGYFWLTPSPEETSPNETSDIEKTSEEIKTTPSSERITEKEIVQHQELDSAQQALINIQNQSQFGIFSTSTQGTSQDISIQNDKLRITLDTKGGLFKNANLIDGYTNYWTKEPIALWNEELSAINLSFEYSGKGNLSTDKFYFEPSSSSAIANDQNPASIKMKLKTNDPNKYIEYIYTLRNGSYQFNLDINIVGLDNIISTNQNSINLNWTLAGNHNEKGIEDERRYSSIFYREVDENRDYLSEGREDEEVLEHDLNWMSFKQKFFSVMIISDQGFQVGAKLENHAPEEAKDTTVNMFYSASLPLKTNSLSNTNIPLRFYFGPNEFNSLKSLSVDEVTRIIDYGPWIIGWVNRYIVRPMYFFFSKHISSVGLVILIITLIIKMALFPVTWKNYLSSAKMRVLKPQIEEINAKFEGKDKAMEKQQATMTLYRQTGVNPFAGCIPMLFQMPILYAMFRFFPASIELRGKSFLWAEDLSSYDSIFNFPGGFEIPFYGAHISGFTLLMAASTFVYTRMNSSNMPTQSQPGMPNMKVIMNFFPIMMLFFFNKFSSALSLYYFVANMISISQMWSIKKWFVNEDKILAKMEEKKKNPKKKSNFQQKLEEMQKQQQELKKKKKN